MSKRRSNGEGSIFREKKTGRYRIAVTKWENGQKLRKTKVAWKIADARAALDELRGDNTITTGPMSVADFLQKWLKEIVRPNLEESTHESYKLAVDNHISARIGGLPLKKARTIDVHSWLTKMADDEVGSRTRENAFKVFKMAMDWAVDIELLSKNPCAKVSKPSHEPEEIDPFTLEEAKELLVETSERRVHGMLQLALTAGMRQGEIFGLRWDRIDFKKRLVQIDQQVSCISGKTSLKKPKTKASVRTIEITESCRDALIAHRAIMLKEGNAGNELAFPAPEGGLIGRSTFRTRVWVPLVKSLLLKERGFHHTRHTYATIALGAGVPVTVVSKALGHAKVSTTMDIYSHVLQSHKTAATETIARLFG